MVPSTVVVPEMNVAVLAGVFHPVGLLGMLAALVVVVMGGLCLALATDRRLPMRARPTVTVRVFPLTALASDGEDPAVA